MWSRSSRCFHSCIRQLPGDGILTCDRNVPFLCFTSVNISCKILYRYFIKFYLYHTVNWKRQLQFSAVSTDLHVGTSVFSTLHYMRVHYKRAAQCVTPCVQTDCVWSNRTTALLKPAVATNISKATSVEERHGLNELPSTRWYLLQMKTSFMACNKLPADSVDVMLEFLLTEQRHFTAFLMTLSLTTCCSYFF